MGLGEGWEKSGSGFQEFSPGGVTRGALISFGSDWRHLLSTREIIRLSAQVFLCWGWVRGVVLTATLHLAHTKVRTPRRKAGVPHKPYCLHNFGTVSCSYCSGNRSS